MLEKNHVLILELCAHCIHCRPDSVVVHIWPEHLRLLPNYPIPWIHMNYNKRLWYEHASLIVPRLWCLYLHIYTCLYIYMFRIFEWFIYDATMTNISEVSLRISYNFLDSLCKHVKTCVPLWINHILLSLISVQCSGVWGCGPLTKLLQIVGNAVLTPMQLTFLSRQCCKFHHI